MTRLARTCAVVLFVAGQASLAAAQTVPSTFKDLQFLVRPGNRVTVVDTTGIETIGRITELDASALSMTAADGVRRFIRKTWL